MVGRWSLVVGYWKKDGLGCLSPSTSGSLAYLFRTVTVTGMLTSDFWLLGSIILCIKSPFLVKLWIMLPAAVIDQDNSGRT